MGGSRQLHRLLALQPQGKENNQQTYWYSGHISALMFCAFLLRNSQ